MIKTMVKQKLNLLITLLLATTGVFAVAQHYNCDVADIVTQQFFDDILSQRDPSCEGNGFYTREAFLHASASYPNFAQYDNMDYAKREIAALFAIISYETLNMCYIEHIDKSNSFCDDKNSPQYPCAPGIKYYGRGPIQISWNFNYGPAGDEIGFDGLKSPETVIANATISFRTAFWYWMKEVRGLIISQGFGAVIRAFNGNLECDGKNPDSVSRRVNLYLDYCKRFDVTSGGNITC